MIAEGVRELLLWSYTSSILFVPHSYHQFGVTTFRCFSSTQFFLKKKKIGRETGRTFLRTVFQFDYTLVP
jgi:hypothetical protein